MTNDASSKPGDVPLAGPILFARGSDASVCRVAVLTIVAGDRPVSVQVGGATATPERLDDCDGRTAWRHELALPIGERVSYRCAGQDHAVCTRIDESMRLAYLSCNGQERGDTDRPVDERNRLWMRLAEEHARDPFTLLMHGGDQLYADEVLESHADIARWSSTSERARGDIAFATAAREAASRCLFERYVALYAQRGVREMLASVPSIMMWDDHDIVDGWGSHAAAVLDSPIGRGLFENARRWFRVFQQAAGGANADDETTSSKRTMTLGSTTRYPDFAVIAPDLRSERRPERILGETGWGHVDGSLAETRDLPQTFLMSSVPLLGPRLSWIERVIWLLPRLRRYEDDLRDQWQSRAHRAEWCRMLTTLEESFRQGGRLTVLSGEIHLASRGEMPFARRGTLHQLIASGISHPAPPSRWARALGTLARLGEAPLPGRPIRLLPVPGQRGIYAAERNYLVIERVDGSVRAPAHRSTDVPLWQASWELEHSGRTPPLAL